MSQPAKGFHIIELDEGQSRACPRSNGRVPPARGRCPDQEIPVSSAGVDKAAVIVIAISDAAAAEEITL